MTKPPEHDSRDDFRAAQPRTARTEARLRELAPTLERAERDDAAMTALLVAATDTDARLIGRAFGERVSQLSHRHEYAAATRLLERLGALASGSRVRAQLAGGMAVGLRPAGLAFDAATHAEGDEFPEVQALLDALLDEMVAPAVMGAASIDNRDRRRIVLARLEVRGALAAQGAAAALAHAPAEAAAVELVALCERAGSREGSPGLETALGHPAAHVRQEALKALLRITMPELANERALAALDGPDAASRRVALDHVVSARLADAVPKLRRLAEADGFDDLEYADKKRVLVGLAGLTGEGAHNLLARLLRQRNLLRRREIDETRIAAAGALAVLRDPDSKAEILRLRERAPKALVPELEQALLHYQRQAPPAEVAQAEATARLKTQPPARTPVPSTRPQAAASPPSRGEGARTPVVGTAPSGERIDLDSEPPLLPTSHVSVPHAQGSLAPQTRPRSRPVEVALADPPPPLAPGARTRPAREGGPPADVVDPPKDDRKDD